MLARQEAGRQQAERAVGSPAVPAPRMADLGRAELWTMPPDYFTPQPAPDLLRQAGAIAIPTLTTTVGSALGVPGMLAGAYLGRRANVALGLEPEGLGGDVASIVLPAGQALYGGLAGVARSMVGTSRPAVAVPERDILGRRGGILTSERGSIQGPAALPWRPFASRDAAPLQPVIDARAASPTMRMAGYTPDLQLRVRLAPGRENTQMLRVEYQSERSRAPLIWANFSREGALLATAPEMAPEELQTFTALAQEAAARLQQTPDWMRPLLGQALYVRFGSLPRGGASQDFARGQRLRGVSVYPARADPLEHVLRFDEAHPHTGEHAFTIGTVLDRPAWLVTGKEVGIGPDNEPLLDAVTPLVRIQYQPQAGGFLPKSGVGTRARRRLQEILTNERGGISLDRLNPRLAAAASRREPVASAVTPARAEAADPVSPYGAGLPPLSPGAARMALPDLPDRPPAAMAPAAGDPAGPAPFSFGRQTFVGDTAAQLQAQQAMLARQEAGRQQAERAVGSPAVPAPTGLGQAAMATGISIGGSMLGVAAGTLAAPFLGPAAPAGPILGEMAGSYGARKLNVALGLEKPDVIGDVASVAVPPALRGVSKVVTPLLKSTTKAVIRHLPGAATAMHQEVAERLARMTDSLLPPVDSRTLYGQVARYNPAITPTAVARDAADILQAEMALQPSLRNGKLMRVANDLKKLTASGTVDMDTLYAHQQRVGELVREARSKGGVGEGRIKQLYAAFHEDLETAASKGIQGAEELKNAIAASRKEHIAAEFDELFKPGSNGVTIDPEGRISLNGGRMETAWKRTLRRDKVLRDTLTPEEKAEVEGIITLAQRLERLNVPRGGQRGSGRAAVGAAIGATIGGPAGAAVGVYGPELIAKAMQTQAGRALVRRALEETSTGGADTTALNALAALVRQQMHAPEPSPAPTP
jgi:hypothetical protein